MPVRSEDLAAVSLWRRSLARLAVAAAQAEDEVEGGLLLDVVVGEGAAVLELLAREDQPLLVGRDALLVLDLGLDVVDRVGRLDLERDGLAGEGLDEDLSRAGRSAAVGQFRRGDGSARGGAGGSSPA